MNRDYCTQNARERLEAIALMNEDLPLAQIYPLTIKNHLHPMSNMDGEEDAQRITVALPPLIVSVPPAPIT